MVTLVIKNLPDYLHAKLKSRAVAQHRSMTGEAIALLEAGLAVDNQVREIPPPYKGKLPLTGALIDEAKRSGRS